MNVVLVGCGAMSKALARCREADRRARHCRPCRSRRRRAKARAREYELAGAVIGTSLDAVLDQTKPASGVRCRGSRRPARRRAFRLCPSLPSADGKAAGRQLRKMRAPSSRRRARPGASMPSSRTAAMSPMSGASGAFSTSGAIGDADQHPRRLLRRAAFRRLSRGDGAMCCCSTWRSIHSTPPATWSAASPPSVYCQEWEPANSWYRQGSSASAIFDLGGGKLLHLCRLLVRRLASAPAGKAAWRIVAERGSLVWDG